MRKDWDHREIFEAQMRLTVCQLAEDGAASAYKVIDAIDPGRCDQGQTLRALQLKAEIAFSEGDLTQAHEWSQRAAEGRRKEHGWKSEEFYESIELLVQILKALGESEEAEVLSRRLPRPYKVSTETTSLRGKLTRFQNKPLTPVLAREDHNIRSHEVVEADQKSSQEVLNATYTMGDAPEDANVDMEQMAKDAQQLHQNWLVGHSKCFQLPHPDHPEEGHTECVYSLQYRGNHLVSASRDETIRIWDLETQRPISPPLRGHSGSVLCVQFDSSDEEDLIVSGGVDGDVILWQFSSGKEIRRISNAHEGSVLNLKFDKRFLFTCSKDKSIKIWNRKALLPYDDDYPRKGAPGGGWCPSNILYWTMIPLQVECERMIKTGEIVPIAEYSLIMKIDDHRAAVNTIDLFGDQLVSGSGDKVVRIFDVHSGVRTGIYEGHSKGVASVQYDGRRIVSCGNDDTIRVYNPGWQVEEACLRSHRQLVRTVQASFNDHVPGENTSTAKIVSGSYDETIRIWTQAEDGQWSVLRTLELEDVLKEIDKGKSGTNLDDTTAASVQIDSSLNPSEGGSSVANVSEEAESRARAKTPPPRRSLRVFKLQFDARRLVCCSQESRIIGWDFSI